MEDEVPVFFERGDDPFEGCLEEEAKAFWGVVFLGDSEDDRAGARTESRPPKLWKRKRERRQKEGMSSTFYSKKKGEEEVETRPFDERRLTLPLLRVQQLSSY